ncbi:M56 family metallopeptidase [Pseudoalteromonas denitrificans]|uniref:TonB family C-terminal domain-containing protein n=1 Tax=Pseudoalteromonas denitrificans DSM 6059 TaxID=1123010 RepID=A0A1I1RFR6_9GAMM|nr:M56 family metallopeptidase [Pseudoalteromonas denitrificans]SFD33139.1 TonB family C-terminal domain-containing protein [Pseudoalteromonas denitrificans DSM 6059]
MDFFFFDTFLSNPVFKTLSLTLLHFIWQGSVLAVFLAAFLKLISNKYSNLRYNVSLFVLVLCLISPVLTFLIINEPQSISNASISHAAPLLSEPEIVSVLFNMQEFDIKNLLPWLSVIWMLGVIYFSIGYCKELFSVYKLPKSHVSKPQRWLSELFLSLKEELSISQNVTLRVSKIVDVPMVIGWLKPVVLVPLNMITGLTEEQLRLLIAHELAHVKRHDYFVNLIQSLVEVFLFFHPGVKWISKQIRIDREYCCDDIAATHFCEKISYAKALLHAEELRPRTIPLMAMAATGGHLRSRVSRVVGEHSCTPKYANRGMAGLIGLAVVCLLFSTHKVIGMSNTVTDEYLETLKNKQLMLVKPEIKENLNDISVQIAPDKSKEQQGAKKLTTVDIPIQKQQKVILNQSPSIENDVLEKKQVIVEKHRETQKPSLLNKTELVLEVAPEQKKITVKTKNRENKPVEKIAELNSKIETLPLITNKIAVVDSNEYKPLVIPPKALKMIKPDYSEVAQRKGYVGDVVISFNVNLDGKASDIEFMGDTKSYLKKSVRKAMKKWRFTPGKVNGNEIVMRETKLFSFVNPNLNNTKIRTGSRISSRSRRM